MKYRYLCNKCGGEILKLKYHLQKNNTLHLRGYCFNCKWRFLPFVDGLDIETVESMKKKKNKRQKEKLFD